jgi:hypothetical protein
LVNILEDLQTYVFGKVPSNYTFLESEQQQL